MNDFLKHTLAALLGVVLAVLLFFFLGFIGLIGITASASNMETSVKANSILAIDLNGVLAERAHDNPLQVFIGNDKAATGLDDIIAAIKKAKENDNIDGIYLKAGSMNASTASLEAIRRALVDYKECGKFLVAYIDSQASQGMYYLASTADKIAINPEGHISWHGIAAQPMFFKNLLDKLGIEMQIFKVGTYKSAVEPYIETKMSDANRAQITEYANALWAQMTQDVAESRGLTVDKLNELADKMMDIQSSETYLADGLADTILYYDGMKNYLKQLSSRGEDDGLRTVSVADMKGVKRNVPKNKSGKIIAVYYASGEIVDAAEAYNMSEENIVGTKMAADLRELRLDESVQAVVLRVNSPGGSAYASEQIWNEVQLLKETKPIIVSMSDYAASGGYYISCAADSIVAEATTLTGSIGIFGMFPNMGGLLTDKVGLTFDMVKTNKMSDFGVTNRPMNEDEKALMQSFINRGYELFTKRCAEGRGMNIDSLKQIAEGRVWTGKKAKELGLVDELGGLERAIEIAAEKAGLDDYNIVNYPEPSGFLSQILKQGESSYVRTRVNKMLGNYAPYLQFVQHIEHANHVQARLPFYLDIR